MSTAAGSGDRDLERDQAIADLTQAIGDREQDLADIDQRRLDAEQGELEAQAAQGRLTEIDASPWQQAISAAQDRRDSHQRSLDAAQVGRDGHQQHLNTEWATERPPAPSPSSPDVTRLRIERALERARAAEARATAAQARAQEARMREEQRLKDLQ